MQASATPVAPVAPQTPAAAPAKAKAQPRHLLRRMAALIRPYRPVFWGALALTLGNSLLRPVVPYLYQRTLDTTVVAGDLGGLRTWILIIVGLVLVQTVVSYFQTWITNWLGQRVMNDLRQQVFGHILSLRLKYFDRNPIGTLQTRTISDIQTLNQVYSEGLVTILGELLQLITILGIMLWVDWRLTLVVLSILPLILLATAIFRRKVKVAFELVRRYVARLNAFLQEHITGMLVTQLFHREAEEMRRFREVNAQHRDANLKAVKYYSIFFPVVEIISALALALLVWYGAGEVLRQDLTFGVLVSFLMYIQMFFRPIRMLADQFNTLQMGLVSAERIFKVLDTDEFIADKPQGRTADALGTQARAIEFEHVRFAYNEPDWILRDVSFTVAPGTTTAIVGATGAGKSSVINVLMRLYEIQGGSVRVGGVDTRDYRLTALRGSMGLVLQDVFLFSGTVRENVTLFNPDIPLARVEAAARLVGAHDFISALPGGYDYRVGERGATLSTGQRQLLSFVRVLVYDPRILLLDEATSNIDTETELLIQDAMAKVLHGRTAIVIAHRLSTIQKADQILVLHKGEIVERGNHQQLLAQNGYYKKLYRMQYGAKAVA